ncbi:MAG: purine-nucleoside phosphorylase [Lachnospirales bacterium]
MLKQNFDKDYYQKSADYILNRVESRPKVAIILGSCLGGMASLIENPIVIKYSDIPNFLLSTVDSHAGELIFGRISNCDVVCLSGRFHYYEGYDFEELSIPVRVLSLLGVKTLIVSNAVGGINESYIPGDIMLIKDHIKLYGASPMRGKNIDEFGKRFFDTTDMYTKELQKLAVNAAKESNIDLKEGVYFYYPGPQFESPAEIRAFRILGGDVVGMSTVTEAISAAHCGMKVLGLSLVVNMAAGITGPVTTEEVDETAKKASGKFQKLVMEIIKNIN